MTAGNADQIALWNEDLGQRWVREQARLDASIAPFGAAALKAAAAKSGEVVLDIGCGCGDTSLLLAQAAAPGGRVLGVDVSAPMLARARARAKEAGLDTVRFEEGDASSATLGGPFDLLFSRFGVMFFDDPLKAFRHMRSAMKPTGRMAFVCWRGFAENAWATTPAAAAIRVLGAPKPGDPFAPGPFAFGDADRTRAILEGAGWRAVTLEAFDAPMVMGRDVADAAWWSTQMGPAGAMLREAGEHRREEVIAALVDALKPFAGPAGVALPGAVWIVSATA
ncbi:MAG: class I SAM-dependent methyltransferase [Hyphomonadaceae bacterium]|nr:class I SAM-dependent methyltransferase [Hyphomonadaceae bacterium]